MATAQSAGRWQSSEQERNNPHIGLLNEDAVLQHVHVQVRVVWQAHLMHTSISIIMSIIKHSSWIYTASVQVMRDGQGMRRDRRPWTEV